MSAIEPKYLNRFIRLLRLLWLASVVGLTLEIAARVDDWMRYDAPLLRSYEFDRLFEITDRGLRGVPHGRYMRWSLNKDGLRGPEIPADAGRTRVIVYGASEVFGVYEDNGKEFPRALETELNTRTAPGRYDVINAGIPGMRVGSGVSLLRELYERLRPRAIVIYPTPTHYIGVTKPYCDRPPMQVSAKGFPWPGLRIGEKFKDTVKDNLPLAAMTLLRKASIAWQNRGHVTLDRIAPASLDALEVDLRCALRTARELRMTAILVTHANRFGNLIRPDDADRLTQWRLQYPEMQESGFVNLEERANKVIRKVALDENVLLVDAAAALNGHADWFADHAHFSNAGSARMGALLAQAVLAALDGP